jgi:RHS repeat-associated protein
LERETLHVTDDTQRVALIETRTKGDDGTVARLIRYQFGNHLSSASLELDDVGRVISYEEYYPYGSTSYQAVRSQIEAPKRYRYTAMERDQESGLNYHYARYYAPHLGRWLSCEPSGLRDGVNLYRYTGSNPIRYVDRAGAETEREKAERWRREVAVEMAAIRAEQERFRIETIIRMMKNYELAADYAAEAARQAAAARQYKAEARSARRVAGTAKIVGGVFLAIGGCSVTLGAGCYVAAAVGAGESSAGTIQTATGQETRNPIEHGASKALQAVGVSEERADQISQSAVAGYSLAVGAYSIKMPPRAKPVSVIPGAAPAAGAQAALSRAESSALNARNVPGISREVSIATGEETFIHTTFNVPLPYTPEAAAVRIVQSKSIKLSPPGLSGQYGQGAYAYEGVIESSLPQVQFRVPPGTAIERIAIPGERTIIRLLPAEGNTLPIVDPVTNVTGEALSEARELARMLKSLE